MARRKIEERNIRSLMKTAGGGTFALTLPIEIVREMGWEAKQKLVVKKQGNKIIIKDWEPGDVTTGKVEDKKKKKKKKTEKSR